MSDRHEAYKEAGVDIEAGNLFVDRIKRLVASTHTTGVVSDIGGFGGMLRLGRDAEDDPVLVASTDGVGTKLKLAFAFNIHDTIGIDLVAMNVNDLVVQGAKPLFFLDYLATGKLDLTQGEEIIKGIVDGCKESGCALLGGETAEMPDFYAPGEYDLSGFSVGIVSRKKVITGSNVQSGDLVIGLESSGIHSNGYSLVRKVFKKSGLKGDDTFPGTSRRVKEVLLEPTRIYVQQVLSLVESGSVQALAHITGGGFYDNIPRILPEDKMVTIDFNAWDTLPVFAWLKEQGDLSWPEMLQIFNCGIGFIVIVREKDGVTVMDQLSQMGQQARVIGRVRERENTTEQVQISF